MKWYEKLFWVTVIIYFAVAFYGSWRTRTEVTDAATKSLQPSPDAIHCSCRSAVSDRESNNHYLICQEMYHDQQEQVR